jgi:large conductance mechanosensitive channel
LEVCFISDDFKSTDEAILAELRLIREELVKTEIEPEPEPEKRRIRRLADDFLNFIKKYRVFGLAVAFIMALYTGALVQAIVDDLLLPILSYIPGLGSWATFQAGPFLIGHFVSAVVTFILVSFVVYIIVKIATKIGIED